MSNWDNLSIREKNDIIKVAVRNGLTSLADIKNSYNSFDVGGSLGLGDPPNDVNPLEYTHSRFPITENLDVSLYNDPNFHPPGGGNIEYMMSKYDDLPYYNNYQKLDNLKGKSVVVYNNDMGNATNEAIALDIISHGLREQDPYYRKKVLKPLTKSLKKQAAYFADREGLKGTARKEFKDSYVDGILRNALVKDEYRDPLNYWRSELNETIENNPEAHNALTEAYSYINPIQLAPITVTPHANGGLLTKNYFDIGGPLKKPVNNTPGVFIPWGIPQDNTPTPRAGFTREVDRARRAETQQKSQSKYSQPTVPVNSEPAFKSDYPNAWGRKHQTQWYNFLKKQGLDDSDAARLSLFFTAQDDVESATGTSNYAKRKNNYGGMERVVNGKNVGINYPSVEAYMADKWKMMNRKFSHALGANSIEEYAAALGHPDQYLDKHRSLYYVYGNNVNTPGWRELQIGHMNNYINGMKARAGIAGKPYLNGGFDSNTYVAQNYQDMYNVPKEYRIPEEYAFPDEINYTSDNGWNPINSYMDSFMYRSNSTDEYNEMLAKLNGPLVEDANNDLKNAQREQEMLERQQRAQQQNLLLNFLASRMNRNSSEESSYSPMEMALSLFANNQNNNDNGLLNAFGNMTI